MKRLLAEEYCVRCEKRVKVIFSDKKNKKKVSLFLIGKVLFEGRCPHCGEKFGHISLKDEQV